MLSIGELVVLAGAAVFFLGRKEGLKMIQTSGKTLNKFWKQVSKEEGTALGKTTTTPKAAPTPKESQAAKKD
jgi:Sec-independent protein translocase protein TatA